MALRSLVTAFSTVLTLAAPFAAAQTEDVKTSEGASRLVFMSADPSEGRPGNAAPDLKVLALPELPEAGEADVEVLAALLRSSPVSTFIATPDSPSGAQTGDLHLVLDATLGGASGESGVSVEVGGESMSMQAFGERLKALTDALNPERRQTAYIRLSDPEDHFAGALGQLRSAIDPAGFGMSVLMVGVDAATCEGARSPIHYTLIGGLADGAPFGDDNGKTTLAEAMSWVQASLERDVAREAPCAARYSLILRGDQDPERVLVETGGQPLFPEMETAVYREKFQSLFLMTSSDSAQIGEFLDSCTYCPNESELTARQQEIGERQLALELEKGIWDEIRGDDTPGRIEVYLSNCQLCAYRDEAEAAITQLAAAEEARTDENDLFRNLVASNDLPGLRDWIDTCIACDFIDDAREAVATLENDSRVEEELSALKAAIEARNADEVESWLASCEICSGQDEAQAALDDLVAQAEAARPCVEAAGLPQQGGPRLLTDIDQSAARATCGAALTRFPGNPLAVTALGRIEQAAGNMTEAQAAYEAGMEAGIPAAYGLAAHSLYAPGNGTVADYEGAEQLAVEGMRRGDWLSGEVLTVLYSRELIDGKGPAEAAEIALEHAEAGNPVAQFFTGYFYRIGSGVPANDREAVRWLQAAVDRGYTHANSFLAEIYEDGGEGVPADADVAGELYWSALEAGDPTATDRLSSQINDRPSPVVRVIQTRLQQAGVFNGRVDGIGGNATASAVLRYAASVQGQ
ncbi:SEL1-like repeat protein [Pelagovum pacificum]|uniref:SEL1-like repeat protein n=1 Tax=Pelagovum pacificum TaxID=2588711 RepID=A0A5C5GCF8_9RHOB|nr:SEL1-like repeat protein [Pelagovum pacificum]QQA44472.1 SEL1-like repeat protein [Pelagovum pacificum]TNY32413.1 SEL1-like repeat protein [Pelagovum pacificum]